MTAPKIGVQLHPQATTTDELRRAWRAADEMGVDSIWVWDHFYPLYGDPEAAHFEAYTLLADMARTIDHLSGGRFTLGIGSGWFERDYDEYGFEFGTAIERLHKLRDALPRIKDRLGKLTPGPVGPLPILIGGSGEKVTLRLVAEHADGWNAFGPPESFAAKGAILDEWCAKVGRAPKTIERTVAIRPDEIDRLDDYVAAGADHLIVMLGSPFDLDPVSRLLDAARG